MSERERVRERERERSRVSKERVCHFSGSPLCRESKPVSSITLWPVAVDVCWNRTGAGSRRRRRPAGETPRYKVTDWRNYRRQMTNYWAYTVKRIPTLFWSWVPVLLPNFWNLSQFFLSSVPSPTKTNCLIFSATALSTTFFSLLRDSFLWHLNKLASYFLLAPIPCVVLILTLLWQWFMVRNVDK